MEIQTNKTYTFQSLTEIEISEVEDRGVYRRSITFSEGRDRVTLELPPSLYADLMARLKEFDEQNF